MALFRCSSGGSSGGTKGANGSLTVSTGTTYEIDTGLTTVDTFVAYGQGKSSGNASTVVVYDNRRNASTLIQGGGSTTIQNKGTSLPLANSATLIGITSISGGVVTIKSPTGDATVNGSIFWVATGS